MVSSSPIRTLPLAVFTVTPLCARSTVIAPFAALRRRSPVTSPIQLSPLEFLTVAGPSIRRMPY
jgi:hypothetical protein